MNKEEHINYWLETAEQDYHTMLNLLASKDYHWSLFLGHLVIEKTLKALYVRNIDSDVPPKTHDLLRLAEKAEVITTDENKDILDLVTTFNISARYPDYKQSFYKKCTLEFTNESIAKIKELRLWLLRILGRK